MAAHPGPPTDVPSILAQLQRPARVVVTAGMPYANGPLHLGHLAGAQLPADIYARYMGMLVGRDNVLFVCGTDEHGSTTELAALQAGVPVRELLDGIHDKQERTLARYSIGLDVYSGTSRPECFPIHKELSQGILKRLNANGLLEKRTSKQWFDPKAGRFLPDRLVYGKCPNPACDNTKAYSDECDRCGKQYAPTDLIDPKSAISDAVPEMRDTVHWFLDMGAVAEEMRVWIEGKKKKWRASVIADTLERVTPSLRFDNVHEPAYKELKASLPKHRSKYAAGKKVMLQLESAADLVTAEAALAAQGVQTERVDEWAKRSITRDIAWGIPVGDIDPALAGKTLYVWPDSLIAPIAFSQVALAKKGASADAWRPFWTDPNARITQFLGQDNVFFYVLMQGALWLGSQEDPHHLPRAGELQMTDIVACCHLLVNGEKMSKSRGNFFTADELLDDKHLDADQVRYYLALLDLSERPSDFDEKKLAERNDFLAGPMNAALEKAVSAAHSKFDGRVPDGVLDDKVVKETVRLVQRYVKAMEKSEHPALLFEIENYARTINSLFTQHKPHDDRMPLEQRKNALFTSFYVLKNLMILLYPFVPATMNRLRETLRLPPDVFRLEELGTGLPAGHELGHNAQYFPQTANVPGHRAET